MGNLRRPGAGQAEVDAARQAQAKLKNDIAAMKKLVGLLSPKGGPGAHKGGLAPIKTGQGMAQAVAKEDINPGGIARVADGQERGIGRWI